MLTCLCLQVDSVEAVLEMQGFVGALLQGLAGTSTEHWKTERAGLLLQLLCACHRCLQLHGDCRPLLELIQQLLPTCQQVRQHGIILEMMSLNSHVAEPKVY